MPGEWSERTDRKERSEPHEDNYIDESVDRALDELEEKERGEGQSVDEKVDEFLDELEEDEERRREIDERVHEALDKIEENEQQERNAAGILDGIEDARDDLHREFVHDMHEQCPAKEATSEEARRYYESAETGEEVDSSEGEGSHVDSGEGTIQVLETECESDAVSEDASEKKVPSSPEEIINENEEGGKTDDSAIEGIPDSTEEALKQEAPVETQLRETDTENSVELEPTQESLSEEGEVAEHPQRQPEQSNQDELSEIDSPDDMTEDLGTASSETGERLEQTQVEGPDETEHGVEDTEGCDTEETAEPVSDIDTVEASEDASSDSSLEDHYVGGEHAEDGSLEIDEDTLSSESEIQESHNSDSEYLDPYLEDRSPESLESESESEEWHLPSMLPETISFDIFPETEEEDFSPAHLSETLQGTWESLSDEERDEIRPLLRKEIENEEDLEEALERSPSVRYSSDFEDDLEDAHEYLLLSEEDRAPRETPRLLERLMNLEAEHRWAEFLLAPSAESVLDDVPESESSELIPESDLPTCDDIVESTTVETVREEDARTLRIAEAKAEPAKPRRRKKKRRTGYHKKTQHPIKLHQPMAVKRPVASFEVYKKWLERNYPAVCQRPGFSELLESLQMFFELRKALRGRKTITQHEIQAIARKIGLKPSTAMGWALRGQSPHLFKIVDSSLSKREGLRLRGELLEKSDGIGGWAELERRLKALYSRGAYKKIANYSDKRDRVREFFIVLGYLERGGSQKGIARLSGISKRRVRAFFDGEIPWLIRHVLAKTGKLKSSERYRSHLGSVFKTKIRLPRLKGKILRSFREFRRLVDREYPWLKERPDYEYLVQTVREFFEVARQFKDREHFTRDEVVGFTKSFQVSVEAAMEWLKGNSFPMVFDMLERSLSVAEARVELQKILAELNCVSSWNELGRRLRTLYVLEDIKGLASYDADTKHAKRFFRYLDALARGGLLTDIAERAGIDLSDARRFRHQKGFPRLVNIARAIPAEKPRRGYRWIPLWTDKRGRMRDFIQVPVTIRSIKDILRVIGQLKPRRGKAMRDWRKRFGDLDPLDAFMYLLGAIVSDGTVGRKEGISTRLGISLSKRYPWSESFGELFCYCLHLIGIESKREKDTKDEDGNEKTNWMSRHSPLSIWLLRTALGLRRSVAKSKQSIKADWILKMPDCDRLSFLQGITDGDGYASVRGLSAGIATSTNKRFIQNLLASFGIESSSYSNGVVFGKKESLQNASRLPLFRAASGRQFRLEEITCMIDSMDWTPISAEERTLIWSLHSEGYTASEISSILWETLERARRNPTIRKVIQDYERDSA
jgi:hypothetical protein